MEATELRAARARQVMKAFRPHRGKPNVVDKAAVAQVVEVTG